MSPYLSVVLLLPEIPCSSLNILLTALQASIFKAINSDDALLRGQLEAWVSGRFFSWRNQRRPETATALWIDCASLMQPLHVEHPPMNLVYGTTTEGAADVGSNAPRWIAQPGTTPSRATSRQVTASPLPLTISTYIPASSNQLLNIFEDTDINQRSMQLL